MQQLKSERYIVPHVCFIQCYVYGQYIVYKCQWGLGLSPGNEKITRENFVKVPALLAWIKRTDTYRFHSQIKNRKKRNGNKVKIENRVCLSVFSMCVIMIVATIGVMRACVRAGLRDYPEMLVLKWLVHWSANIIQIRNFLCKVGRQFEVCVFMACFFFFSSLLWT